MKNAEYLKSPIDHSLYNCSQPLHGLQWRNAITSSLVFLLRQDFNLHTSNFPFLETDITSFENVLKGIIEAPRDVRNSKGP